MISNTITKLEKMAEIQIAHQRDLPLMFLLLVMCCFLLLRLLCWLFLLGQIDLSGLILLLYRDRLLEYRQPLGCCL